jgi:hypothetical protein
MAVGTTSRSTARRMLFGDAIGYAGEERHDSPLHINRDLKMGLLGQKRQPGCRTQKARPIGSGPLQETKAERICTQLQMWGNWESTEKMPGRFAEGPRQPRLYPARLRSERARKLCADAKPSSPQGL